MWNSISTPLTSGRLVAVLNGARTAAMRAALRWALWDGGYRYNIHPVETAQGLTDANLTFGFAFGDVRRYGAKGDGATDDTTAVQTALNVAYRGKARVRIPEGMNCLVGSLSLTLTGSQTNDGIRITGASATGSRLTCSAAAGTLLSIIGSTPTGSPQPVPVVIENLGLFAQTTSGPDGILLEGVALFRLRNVYIEGFYRNVYLNSALVGTIQGCGLYNGTYGVYARQDGAGANNNLVTIRDSVCDGMTLWGIDWGAGDRLKLQACDIESNGQHTALAFTAAPGAGATSATLNAAFALPTAQYPVYFSDGEVRMVALTNGATTATWAGGLASAVTTAATLATGALVIRNTCAAIIGFATIDIDGCWFEVNNGQTLAAEADQAGDNTTLAIRNSNFYSDYNGYCIYVPKIGRLSIEDSNAPSGVAAVWQINSGNTDLRNVAVHTLTDTSPQSRYFGVTTSNGLQYAPQVAAPYTYAGKTASTASGVAVTAVTLPVANFASYLVSAQVPGVGDAVDYACVSIVSVNGSAASAAALQTAPNMSITLSGLAVQVKQTSGGAAAMQYSILQIA